MTSEPAGDPDQAYVWVWLPDSKVPVAAGRLERVGDLINFNYGESYLERSGAIQLYLPELPLRRGRIEPRGRLRMPGAWGQRVIMQHLLGRAASSNDPVLFGPLTYLLAPGGIVADESEGTDDSEE